MKHRITIEIETDDPTRVLDKAIEGVLSVAGTQTTLSRVTEIVGEPVKIRLLLNKFREDDEVGVLGAWLESEAKGKDFQEDVEDRTRDHGPMYRYSMITIATAGFERAFPAVPEESGEVV